MLYEASKSSDIQIVSVDGGEKDNAIAKFAECVFAVPQGQEVNLEKALEHIFEEIGAEYHSVERHARIDLTILGKQNVSCMTKQSGRNVIAACINLPNGVQRMNPDMPDMVQTSLNLGILKTEENQVTLSYAVRSSSETEKQFLISKLESFTELLGGSVSIFGQYPGWEYKADSKLRVVMVDAYKELYGKEPVVLGIHAGLECGLFASKLEGLDAVSFGPQMGNIHTTDEVLSISSTKRTWELVLKILESLAG
jgi:dipeptidase D